MAEISDEKAAKARRAVNAKLVLLLWVFVAFLYFNISYDYVRVTSRDRQFKDYIEFVVQLAGTENRSVKEIRDLLLVKADSLMLPVHGDQIVVKGSGANLNIIVNYDVDIEVPLIQREIYQKHFEHNVRYQGPR
jgi:hypothetical protein